MAYFTKYPKIRYPFGGQSTTSVVQDIGVYIDLIDRIKDNASYYKEYPIRVGDRPDTVSQVLYGTPDYYWTFFLLNDDLKLRGWPLSDAAITQKAKEEYPNKVLVTREDMTGRFQPGDIVKGLNSGAYGKILRRRPDMGQIIVQPIPNPDPGPNESATAIIPFEDDEDAESISIELDADGETVGSPSMRIDRVVDEYNAKHHYENADGDHVDIFPRAPYVQRFKIPISFSPTNYLYINVAADPLAGDPVAIYFNPNLAASATNPIPDAATIAGIIEAEKAILVPQFTAYGSVPALTQALVDLGQMTTIEKATYDGAAAIGQLTLETLAEQIALATSATGVSPLKNFEVNTTTYAIEDTSDPADGVTSAGAWLFDLTKDVTLSTFDNLDVDLTLNQANAVALLGNLLPGASILQLLFVALQLIDGKKATGLPLSLQEFNVFFTAVFGFQQANASYQAAVVALFADILNKNLPKYQASASNDIIDNRIQAEFEYFFIVDKLVDGAGAADVSTIGTVVKYTADDYTAAAANVATQTATFQGIATAGGHSTVATYAPALAAFPYFILTTDQSNAYVAAELAGQLDLPTLIGQLAFGAALAANPPVEKTYYKVLYSDQPIQSGSSETITIFDENSALVTSVVTDFTSKDDAYDELKTIFDDYIVTNYDDLEPALLTPTTFLERYVEQNNTLKTIKVLRPESIQDFDAQFRRILGEAISEEVIVSPASQGASLYTSTPEIGTSNIATSATSTSTSTSSSSGSSGY